MIVEFLEFMTVWTTLAVILGTGLGVAIGALPGLSSSVGITMILPFTFALGQGPSIALMLGVYVGSIYGGSISAILLNTPGTPAAAATAYDGFALTERGQAGLALGWATIGSLVGGLFSLGVLMVAAPQFAELSLRFGPVETFALTLFAMTCLSIVSQGAMWKGLLAGIIGLFLTVVGQDLISGDIRFTFGNFALAGGIGLLPVLIGVFALSEVLLRLDTKTIAETPEPSNSGPAKLQFPTLRDIKSRAAVFIRSSAIGTGIGVLPGAGAATASFVSYAVTKKAAKDPSLLGTGEPDGIIASEAANNAVTAGALVPTLALGIPGDPVTAVMLGTLVIHGIVPGPLLFSNQPGVVYGIYAIMAIANLAMVAFAVLGARVWMRVLKVSEPHLMAVIAMLCFVGAYSVNNSGLDVLIMIIAGLAGFILRKNGFPTAPIVIGMVIGPVMEKSLRQGLIISDNSIVNFFGSGIATALFVVTLIIFLIPAFRAAQSKLAST